VYHGRRFELPKSYDDLLDRRWKGKLGVEAEDSDWFGGVVTALGEDKATISLAFLAPSLVKAAIEGQLPRGMGVTRLRDAPAEWSRQYAMLGLSI
jgi:hypothetical protein